MHASFICNNGAVDKGFRALFTFAAERFVIFCKLANVERVTRKKPVNMKRADDVNESLTMIIHLIGIVFIFLEH